MNLNSRFLCLLALALGLGCGGAPASDATTTPAALENSEVAATEAAQALGVEVDGVRLDVNSAAGRILAALPAGDLHEHGARAVTISPAVISMSLGFRLVIPLEQMLRADPAPACPSITLTDTTFEVVGGCQAESETGPIHWFGTARGTFRTDEDERTIATLEMEEWGSDRTSHCEDSDHPLSTRANGSANFTEGFAADFAQTGTGTTVSPRGACQPFDELVAQYEGSREDTDDARIFEGRGFVGATGVGRFFVRTEREVVQRDVCRKEPASGTTTARSGDDVAVLTYDGATACDDPGSATWTLNGEAQGDVAVSCSAGGSSGGVLWCLGLVLFLRRRTR